MTLLDTTSLFFFRDEISIIPSVLQKLLIANDMYFGKKEDEDFEMAERAYPIYGSCRGPLDYTTGDICFRKNTFYGTEERQGAAYELARNFRYCMYDSIKINYRGKDFIFMREDIKTKTSKEIITSIQDQLA